MHIVFVARLFSPHLGGVETHVGSITRILAKQGHKITIITWQYDQKLPLEDQQNNIQIVRLPFSIQFQKKATWQSILQLKHHFLTADIVHVHDVFWWIIPLYFSIRKKLFITFHGWETQFPVARFAQLQRWIANKLSRGTIHIGAFIQQFYWDKPDFVLYGGVPKRRKSPTILKQKIAQQQQKPTAQTLHFVFIGRLSADTDVPQYLDFFKLLCETQITFTVTWVGDGVLKSQCESFGEVTGFVENTQFYLTQADFVCASSYLSILQAQFLGKIVFALYSNPLKKVYLETFPGSSYLLIAGSADSLQKKLKHVLATKKLRLHMETEAHDFAQKQTWEKVVAQYAQLWKKKC